MASNLKVDVLNVVTIVVLQVTIIIEYAVLILMIYMYIQIYQTFATYFV